ncbi:hypothetical protein TUM20983_16710 [Mycobacterium antarcticum]|nr:hypothetical protein TUM20983_16710 [Mycolicibacterium sp. TUM20983]
MPTVLQDSQIAWESEVLDEAEAIVRAEWLRVVCSAGSAYNEVAAGLAARPCRTISHINMSGAHSDWWLATATAAQPSRWPTKPKVRATQRSPPSPRREERPSVGRRR